MIAPPFCPRSASRWPPPEGGGLGPLRSREGDASVRPLPRHTPAFASLRVPFRFSKGDGGEGGGIAAGWLSPVEGEGGGGPPPCRPGHTLLASLRLLAPPYALRRGRASPCEEYEVGLFGSLGGMVVLRMNEN